MLLAVLCSAGFLNCSTVWCLAYEWCHTHSGWVLISINSPPPPLHKTTTHEDPLLIHTHTQLAESIYCCLYVYVFREDSLVQDNQLCAHSWGRLILPLSAMLLHPRVGLHEGFPIHTGRLIDGIIIQTILLSIKVIFICLM